MATVTYFSQLYSHTPTGTTVDIESSEAMLPIPEIGQQVTLDGPGLGLTGHVTAIAFNLAVFTQTNGIVNRTYTQVIEIG